MPKPNKFNGAAPLVQPPARTLAVPNDLRLRIEAAYKASDKAHPGALTPQQFLNALIGAGLEFVESDECNPGASNAEFSCCLNSAVRPVELGFRSSMECMAFVRWRVGAPIAITDQLVKLIKRVAPFTYRSEVHSLDVNNRRQFQLRSGKAAPNDPCHEKGLD